MGYKSKFDFFTNKGHTRLINWTNETLRTVNKATMIYNYNNNLTQNLVPNTPILTDFKIIKANG